MNKKAWKRLKKVVWPPFGCAQHPKADQNTQHICCGFYFIELILVRKTLLGWRTLTASEKRNKKTRLVMTSLKDCCDSFMQWFDDINLKWVNRDMYMGRNKSLKVLAKLNEWIYRQFLSRWPYNRTLSIYLPRVIWISQSLSSNCYHFLDLLCVNRPYICCVSWPAFRTLDTTKSWSK